MDAGGARRPNPRGGATSGPGNHPSTPDVFRRDCTMRRIKIIERPGETYSYAAVDRQTGEIPLRLTERAALVALCHRLGWAVDEELPAKEPRSADLLQRPGERHRTHRAGNRARRRLGGHSKYAAARKRQRGRTVATPSAGGAA